MPGALDERPHGPRRAAVGEACERAASRAVRPEAKAPPRGILRRWAAPALAELGASRSTDAACAREARAGVAARRRARPAGARRPERLVIDFGDGTRAARPAAARPQKALGSDTPAAWKALQAAGHLPRQRPAREASPSSSPARAASTSTWAASSPAVEPVVAAVFAEADAVMEPHPGPAADRATSSSIRPGPDAVAQAEQRPDADRHHAAGHAHRGHRDRTACWREYGFEPDMVMGHSLGEYAALVAAGRDALRRRARSRGRARAAR